MTDTACGKTTGNLDGARRSRQTRQKLRGTSDGLRSSDFDTTLTRLLVALDGSDSAVETCATARITIDRITNHAGPVGSLASALPHSSAGTVSGRLVELVYDVRRSAVEARYNRQLRTIIVVPACSTVMA